MIRLFRIDPIPQEVFYVLTEDEKLLSSLGNDSVCFSLTSYRIDEVESGDIPTAAKIVAIDADTKKTTRVNLQTAMSMLKGDIIGTAEDISAAVSNLREVMLRNGLQSPAYIQLHSKEQAYKIISMFQCDMTQDKIDLAMAAASSSGRFSVMGIEFRWNDENDTNVIDMYYQTQHKSA